MMMSPAGGDHGEIALNLGAIIRQHVKKNKLGRAYAAETGFILERNPDTVRAPDVAFIAAYRAEHARTPKFIPIPPDFCAEIVSPNDAAEAVIAMVQWWLDRGVKLVWVVDPQSKTVTSYLPGGDAHVYRDDDTPSLAPVLPDLAISMPELFD